MLVLTMDLYLSVVFFFPSAFNGSNRLQATSNLVKFLTDNHEIATHFMVQDFSGLITSLLIMRPDRCQYFV